MIRMAYVDTAVTGAVMHVNTAEGELKAVRVDPHGVVLVMGGEQRSITPAAAVEVGRFFLAAAARLGEDINAGWDVTT